MSYFEYEMNYVPLLPDMAYYRMGGGGYSSLNALLFFFFFWGEGGGEGKWSIFQGKLKI